MAYTTINKSSDYFRTKLYTGDGTTDRAITFDESANMQPDFTWLKERSSTGNHKIADVIRGTTKYLSSNLSNAEDTTGSGIQSWDTNGFTISNATDINDNTITYVSWNFKAGGTASSNTDGSITSNVSANTTSGFSIVTYTGTSSDNATVGHGLGVIPSVVIFKRRDSTSNWCVIGNNIGTAYTNFLELDGTGAFGSNTTILKSATSSTTLTLGTNARSNPSSGTMVAYCFSEKKGFSKFGSYTGNGNADGTFVYTGFKPAWVMWKRTDSSGYDWDMYDTARDTHNVAFKELIANSNVDESTSTVLAMDILSNGFKLRTTNANGNGSGATYIYMAFAENPLVGTNNIPAVAR